MESQYIHKQHNVSVVMYHIVCAAKYRRVVMSEAVDEVLIGVCLEIAKRWEIWFLEIGVDRDHAHFLVQSVPMYSRTRIVQTVKSITAREVFAKAPEVKRKLWGGEFWGRSIIGGKLFKEYRTFLERHGVAYDERYVWD